MQPEAADRRRSDVEFGEMIEDHVADKRHDILEDLPSLLTKELVGVGRALRIGAFSGFAFAMIEKAEIVADVVRVLRDEPGAENVPRLALRRAFSAFESFAIASPRSAAAAWSSKRRARRP